MMSKTLAALDLFHGLPEDALEAIASFSHEMSFAAGDTICSEGRRAGHIYLLLEGTVELSVSPRSQPEPVTISLLKSLGLAFGWSAIVGSGYYTASAYAASDVRLVAVGGRELMDYLAQNHAVGFEVIKRVAHVVSYRLGSVRSLLLETICD
jgi:CRP-like cAMP-binding protein